MFDVKELMSGDVVIYRRDHSSGVYQVRFNSGQEKKGPRYIRRSLKTKDEGIAIERALAMYREHHSRAFLGISSDFVSIERLLQIASDDVLTDGSIASARALHKAYWAEWFAGKDCSRVRTGDIKSYFKWRIDKQLECDNEKRWVPSSVSVSTSTLKLERALLRKLFQVGKQNNLIARVPGFPEKFSYRTHTISKKERRARFTPGKDGTYEIVRRDLSHIRRILNDDNYKPSQNEDGSWDSWSKRNGVGSSKTVDEEIRWAVKAKPRFVKAQYWFLCVLISNTGIRPAEVIKLRHRDLSIVRSNSDGRVYTMIEIHSDVSKVGRFRDVIASDLHQTFERYLDYRREIEFRFGVEISQDDYLFPSSERYEERRERLSDLVRPNLMRIGLHKKVSASDPNVETYYSAYSFRSWYITQRLKNGLDIYTLAKNCGTSIQTIASTYDYSENWAYRKAMTAHINQHSSGDEPKSDLSAYIKNWK